jgi:hypothetical protein
MVRELEIFILKNFASFSEEQRVVDLVLRLLSSDDEKLAGITYRSYLALPPHLQKKALRQIFSLSAAPLAGHIPTVILYLQYPQILCRTIKMLSFDETTTLSKFFARNKSVFVRKGLHVPEPCEEAIFIAGFEIFEYSDIYAMFQNVARIFRKVLHRPSGRLAQERLSNLARGMILNTPYDLAKHLPGDYSDIINDFRLIVVDLEEKMSATRRLEKIKQLSDIYQKAGNSDLKLLFRLAHPGIED